MLFYIFCSVSCHIITFCQYSLYVFKVWFNCMEPGCCWLWKLNSWHIYVSFTKHWGEGRLWLMFWETWSPAASTVSIGYVNKILNLFAIRCGGSWCQMRFLISWFLHVLMFLMQYRRGWEPEIVFWLSGGVWGQDFDMIDLRAFLMTPQVCIGQKSTEKGFLMPYMYRGWGCLGGWKAWRSTDRGFWDHLWGYS